MKISIVIPVYNSENSLQPLYQKIEAALNQYDWEMILVNDCSEDSSWGAMQGLAAHDKRIKTYNLTNNFGQHNAIMCGLNQVSGSHIVTMDDDLQHPPEEIAKLLESHAKSGFPVVYGQYKKKKHGSFRDWFSKSINRALSKVTGTGYNVTSFRLMTRAVVEELVKITMHNVMIDVLIKDIVHPTQVGHVLVRHDPRTIGESNYSMGKLAKYALNMIFNYTTLPLKIGVFLGITFSAVSIVIGVYYIFHYFIYGITVKGWTSLLVLLTLFFGILFLMLGIIGDYVGKIYLIANKKPQYIIQKNLK